jgi:hypothetical protein
MQAKVVFPFPKNTSSRHVVGSVIDVDEKTYRRLKKSGVITPIEKAVLPFVETATERRFENSTQSPDEYRGRHKNRR